MGYSVKATLVAFAGDPERYPCHAMLNIGDVVTFDGAELKGKFCIDCVKPLIDAMINVSKAGPKYVSPDHYHQFWYSVNSYIDPSRAKYDGNGFMNINKTFDEPAHHLRDALPFGAFTWPPAAEQIVCKDVNVICPDIRTAAVFKIEAYDFATAGHQLPYTRRTITIMDRVLKKGGTWPINQILDLYTEEERNYVYPTLVPVLVNMMVEEIACLNFGTIDNGVLTINEKGADRVKRYTEEIPSEHAKAMKLLDF